MYVCDASRRAVQARHMWRVARHKSGSKLGTGLTYELKEGRPKSFLPCRGLQAGLFQVFIGKKPLFVSYTVCQVELALVSLELIGAHDCHLSNQHGIVMSYKIGAAVGPSLCAVDTTVTRPTPVRCCQLPREGHFT